MIEDFESAKEDFNNKEVKQNAKVIKTIDIS